MKVKHNGCPNNDWALLWTHHLLRSPALHSDSNPMVLKHLKIKSVNTHRGRWKTHGFVKVRCLFDLPSGKPGVTRGRIIFQIGVSITLAGEMPLKSLQIPMVFPWSFCGPHGFYVRSCQVTGISLGPYSSMRFLASSEVRPSRSPARGWKNGRLRHIETYWAYHIRHITLVTLMSCVCRISDSSILMSNSLGQAQRPNTSPPTFPKASFCTSLASAKPTSCPPASGSCILAMTTNTGDQCSRKNKDHHESWSSSRIKCKWL